MVRVGLIGLGKMGLSHQALANAHPDIELVAVCDTADYLLNVISKYTSIKVFNDYRLLLATESLDAVIVATPSRFHGEIVRAALDAGLHVFCEKPFCLDVSEGMQLAQLAEERNRVNQVGYHYRFVAVFQEMKRLLDLNVLGRIHHIRAEAYGPVVVRQKGGTWRIRKAEGGGCLYDYASHVIDLANYLVGPPEAVGGAIMNRLFSADVEDEVYCSLYYPNGLTGQIAANWSDETYRKMSVRVTIWGSNGKIVGDRQEMQLYIRDNSSLSVTLNKGWTIRHVTELTEPVWFYLRGEEYSAQMDHFVQAIKAGRVTTNSTFRSAAYTDLITSAVALNAASNKTPVSISRLSPTKSRKSSLLSRLLRKRAVS